MKTILVFGMLVASAFPAVQAQEAKVDHITIYKDAKGIVYYNEVFFINEENSPVRINNVMLRHIPQETAVLAEAYRSSLFRYLEDHEKDRLRRLAKETLTITIDANGEKVVAVKFGVVVYDAFREYLGGLTAITMDPPTKDMQWDYNPVYLFKFKKYGVVGIYVRQARLGNGGIWNFDEDFIKNEFSEKFGEITKEQIVGSES